MAHDEGAEQFTRDSDEENFSDVDSSDSENEDILKAFEPVVPRSGKRTYGVLVDDLMAERRHKNAKLDEQLVFLRSILPGTHEGVSRSGFRNSLHGLETRIPRFQMLADCEGSEIQGVVDSDEFTHCLHMHECQCLCVVRSSA